MDESPEKTGGSFSHIPAIIAVVLVFYVLSPPIALAFIGKQGGTLWNFYTTFYAPLGWLFDHVKAVHTFYTQYFYLFGINP